MRARDRLTWDARFGDWLFTLALGLALGLLLAGAWKIRRGELRSGLVMALSGVGLFGVCGIAVLDAGPARLVHFQLKPYTSAVAEAAVLASALVLGAAISLAAFVALGRVAALAGRPAPALGAVVLATVVAVGGTLWAVDAYNSHRPGPRHPSGLDRSGMSAATKVIDDLDIPTGLAIAANGDIATLDLVTARLRIFRPDGETLSPTFEVRLPIVDGAFGFHVAFHPEYPAQPFLYATADNDTAAGRVMQLFRIDSSRPDGAIVLLVDDLPVAERELMGSHYGSGIAFCGGSFFLGTGDTEPTTLQILRLGHPDLIRTEAQSIGSARGKVLRWELVGNELVADGFVDSAFPIYALGFRNPFAVGCDLETSLPMVADNGGGYGNDQLRLVTPGMNAEWPLSDRRNSLAEPLLDTGAANTAPTGVAIRDTPNGREAVWSTYESRAIYAIEFDSSGAATGRLRLLAEVEAAAYAIATDSRGCVYFTDTEAVWRLEDGRCDR